jgi:hypothetical protein
MREFGRKRVLLENAMLHRSLLAAALILGLASVAEVAWAQAPAAAVVVQPTPRQSKFEKLATKTGSLQKRTEQPIVVAEADRIVASVVRLEDLTAHEVILALQIGLPEDRGAAVVSEEEIPDLKDSVQYIMENMVGLNESANYVRVEYRALSGASIGYMVHFGTATGGEWAPTAYVYVPASPYYPQAGGFGRLSVQGLQKIVGEAQVMMAGMRQEAEKK